MHHGAELGIVLIVSLALAAGAGLRLLSARTRFPYTIAMLLLGLGVGVLIRHMEGAGHVPVVLEIVGRGAHLKPDLIIFAFLPALVFESAYAIDVHTFRKHIGPIVIYAAPALVVATVATAALMVWLTGSSWAWGWAAALVFGALISATDPVAVVAILRELGVSKRLSVLIEGESLLNDGTSIVVFNVLLAMLTEGVRFDAAAAFGRFVWVVAGGMAVGLGLALVLSTWIERLFNDALSEISLTIVLAYLSMIIAEGFLHVSGVMAVVTAGLWMSGTGRTKISPEVSHFLHRFWGTLGHIANTLIFFLVGLVIATGFHEASASDLMVVGGAFVGVMLIRFALVYACQPFASWTSDGVTARDSAVISWGGLRGAVSLALALFISQRADIAPELRRQILMVTAGVVFLTILINGTTMGRLLHVLGYDRAPLAEQMARLAARAQVLDRVHHDVNDLSKSRQLRAVPWDEVRQRLEERQAELARHLNDVRTALARARPAERAAGYWLRVLAMERQAHWEAFAHGLLSTPAVKQLMREIERQADNIARGDLEPPETRTPREVVRGGVLWRRLTGGMFSFERLALLYDLSRAEVLGAERVLENLSSLGETDAAVLERVRATYQRYLVTGKERIEDVRANLPEVAQAIETRLARRIELNLERDGYEHLTDHGILDESAGEAELSDVEARMKQLGRAPQRVPIPETADLVAKTPLFRGLDETALRELADLTEEMVVPQGEYLFREGDQGDSMYVIARGAVHVLKDVAGEEVVVDVLGRGDIVGEMALLSGARRTASGRAGTSVTLGRLDRSAFARLMKAHPTLSEAVWREFAKRHFDNFVEKLPKFSWLDHEKRLAWFERGELVELEKNAMRSLPSEIAWAFVVTGAVDSGNDGGAVAAVDLAELRGSDKLVAAEPTRVVLLPEPTA